MQVAQGIKTRMGLAEWGLLVTLSVLWGGSFFFAEVALEELHPLTIVLGRVSLAAVALHLVLLAQGRRLRWDPRLWAAFLGMGLLNNAIPFSLIVYGQTQINGALASILNATTPLFAVLVAHLLLADERANARKLTGVAIGFLGVVVMVGATALAGLGTAMIAQLACLTGAAVYALAGVFGRRFRKMGVSPIEVATGQVTASTLLILPLALVIDRPWQAFPLSAGTLAAVLGLATLCTALAYILYFRLLERAGATNLLLVTFLIPATAILLGWSILGETLEPRHLLGMALIGAGLAFIDGRLLDRPGSRPGAPAAG